MASLVDEVKRLIREKEKIPPSETAESEMEEKEHQLKKLLAMADSVSSSSEVENGNAVLLAQRHSKHLGDVYYFDKNGALVYISQKDIEFDKKMKEAQKRIDKINRKRYIKQRFAAVDRIG